MSRWARSLTTLFAAAVAGFLLWFAPHFHRWATGGYWGVIGLMTLAGALVGLSQLHGRDGSPLASFLVAFVPVLVAAGWVILASQPHGNEIQKHVRLWSTDLGITNAVRNLSEHVTVLAFGLGMVFGVAFEPRMVRRGPRKARPVTIGSRAASGAPQNRAPLVENETPTLAESPAQQHAEAAPTVELGGPDTWDRPATADQAMYAERPGAPQEGASPTFAQEPTIEEPALEEPALEEPPVEEPPVEEPPVEEPPVEVPPVEEPPVVEPPVEETTAVTSPTDTSPTSDLSASSIRSFGLAAAHTEEATTMVAQPSLAPLLLPRRFTQSWFVSNGPLVHPAQVPELIAELHRRGWTEETIQQRVIPHLPRWVEADPSAPPEGVS